MITKKNKHFSIITHMIKRNKSEYGLIYLPLLQHYYCLLHLGDLGPVQLHSEKHQMQLQQFEHGVLTALEMLEQE